MTKNLVINSLSSGPLGDTAQEKGTKCMMINVNINERKSFTK